MKKVSVIIAAISLLAGIGGFFIGQIGMYANSAYWWTETYSQMETVRTVGLILIVFGAVDIVSAYFSAQRSKKIIQDVNTQQYATKTCSNCGLIVSKTVKICPKCKNEIQE